MKKINEYFEVSEHVDYTLESETKLTLRVGYVIVLRGGSAVVWDGGRANVWKGGHADVRKGGYSTVWEGGHADVWEGGSATVWEGGSADVQEGCDVVVKEGGLKTSDGVAPVLLAESGEYLLRTCQGLFQAGCSSWLTRDEALKRWDREDDRACLFTLAILSCDWGKA